MYAIVKIAGKQYKVEAGKYIYTNRLASEVGTNVDFTDVLLIDNNGRVSVGAPVVKGATVTAKVLDHVQGDKVIVFKKKRRKDYVRKNGHRQALTKIQIESIKA